MSTLRDHVSREGAQLPLWTSSERLRRRFQEHREKHPWVWTALLTMARRARERGRRRMGIAALFEIARWETPDRESDDLGWKLDNSMRAYYSRALMEEHPDLAGLFETRRLRAV